MTHIIDIMAAYPGDTRSQGISSHDVNLVCQEQSGSNTVMI